MLRLSLAQAAVAAPNGYFHRAAAFALLLHLLFTPQFIAGEGRGGNLHSGLPSWASFVDRNKWLWSMLLVVPVAQNVDMSTLSQKRMKSSRKSFAAGRRRGKSFQLILPVMQFKVFEHDPKRRVSTPVSWLKAYRAGWISKEDCAFVDLLCQPGFW